MKYKCVKELYIPFCNEDGLEIPNKYGFVSLGSVWEENRTVRICDGEVRLENISSLDWIEISAETLSEYFLPEDIQSKEWGESMMKQVEKALAAGEKALQEENEK